MRTREQVQAHMKEIFDTCLKTFDIANQEYAKDLNAFENFDSDARDVGIHRNQSWLVLASKHWRGIASYIRGFTSQREDIRGRIKDMIVYLVLLWAMLDDDKEQKALES